MEKHATYLAHKYPDDQEPSEDDDKYIETLQECYNECEISCEAYLKKVVPDCDETVEKKQTVPETAIQETKVMRICKYEEANLTAVIENLHIVVADYRASMETILDAANEIKSQLEQYCNAQRDYIMCLTDEESVENEMKIMRSIQSKCAMASLEAGKEVEMRKLIKQETRALSGPAVELKLERMKMPAFNRQIRDYPSFKTDFEKQVMPALKSNDAVAYVLKSCLSKEPLDIVRNVDDDIHLVWKRLDERYG